MYKEAGKKRIICFAAFFVLLVLVSFSGCGWLISENNGIYAERAEDNYETSVAIEPFVSATALQLKDIPEYSGQAYIVINKDCPYFEEAGADMEEGEMFLSEFDDLGRTGPAMMMAGPTTYQDGERGATGSFRPTGWHQNKYPGLVDSEPPYLYNRGHLLMWALSGLTDEEQNLLTVTRYMNTEGMLPVEMEILRYILKSGNSVLYRVTPVYDGDDLLAKGALMEAYDPEGDFSLCRFAYNVQPGVHIDYSTGENWEE